jgi:hypothetical protein
MVSAIGQVVLVWFVISVAIAFVIGSLIKSTRDAHFQLILAIASHRLRFQLIPPQAVHRSSIRR